MGRCCRQTAAFPGSYRHFARQRGAGRSIYSGNMRAPDERAALLAGRRVRIILGKARPGGCKGLQGALLRLGLQDQPSDLIGPWPIIDTRRGSLERSLSRSREMQERHLSYIGRMSYIGRIRAPTDIARRWPFSTADRASGKCWRGACICSCKLLAVAPLRSSINCYAAICPAEDQRNAPGISATNQGCREIFLDTMPFSYR